MPGLRREDFVVREDGVPHEVKYLWQESDLPLTVVLLADVSGSEYQFIEQHRQTVLQFLSQVLSPGDRAALVSVERQQRLVTDLTNSMETLRTGVEVLGQESAAILGDPCAGKRERLLLFTTIFKPCGGTALWNGVYFAAKFKLRPSSGRKAILLLTDGWDTGSDHGLVDAIESAQSADAMVYSIRYTDRNLNAAFPNELRKAKRNLERIAWETGGLAFEGEAEKVPGIFKSIETALRNEYVIGYPVTPASHEHRYHKLTVTVTRPGLTVRARNGYYAQ